MTTHTLASCPCCGLIQDLDGCPPDEPVRCGRCLTRLHHPEADVETTPALALALAAFILYFPAILLPFLRVEKFGRAVDSNLLGGALALFGEGQAFIGAVVLTFSVVLPLVKLLLILGLSYSAGRLHSRHRASSYQFMEFIGRWGMLDVLVIALMVVYVKFGDFVQFHFGPGAVVFVGFVLVSMAATWMFDHHCLWEAEDAMTDSEDPDASSPQDSPSTPPPAAKPAEPAKFRPRGSHAEERAAKEADAAHSGAAASSDPPAPHDPGSPPPQGSAGGGRGEKFPKATSGGQWNWIRLWWLVVALAIFVVLYAVGWQWSGQGRMVTLKFSEGRGLKAGDALRFRSIEAGMVRQVRLGEKLQGVDVTVELAPEADRLAVRGSQFWIVFPQVELTGATGLDTVAGAKYIAVLPGPADGPLQSEFTGLDRQPLEDLAYPGGVEVVLQASNAGGVRVGAPIYFRQFRIGGVLSSRLDASGAAVELTCYIRPEYKNYLRENARFWLEDGIDVRLEGSFAQGVNFFGHVGSADTLIRAGIGMAVLQPPGKAVAPGHRFRLHPRPEKEWLESQPDLAGPRAALQPPVLPRKLLLEWSAARSMTTLFRESPRLKEGSGVVVEGGVLAPLDLLTLPTDAKAGSGFLQLDEQKIPLGPPQPLGAYLGVLPIGSTPSPWPANRIRRPATPEECMVIHRGGEQSAIPVGMIDGQGPLWNVPFAWGPEMHGLPVAAQKDGALIGVVVVIPEARPPVRAIVPIP